MANEETGKFAKEWFHMHGADALCTITESFGIGLESTKNIDETACMLSIHEEYTVSSRSIAHLRSVDTEFEAWMSHAMAAPTFQFQAAFLYFWLIADTKVTQHLKSLPQYPELRLLPTYNDEELEFFRGLSVHVPAIKLKSALYHLHESFTGHSDIQAIFRTHKLETITIEQWVSAYQWATSRFMADPRDPDEVCFIPIMDYANHSSSNANVRYEYFDESFHLIHEQELHQGVSVGEELCLDYGVGTRPDLCLMSYGFTPNSSCNPLVLRYNPREIDIFQALDPKQLLPGLKSDDLKQLEINYTQLVHDHGRVQSCFSANFEEDGSITWKDDFLMLIACCLQLNYKYDDNGSLTIAFQGKPVDEKEVFEQLSQDKKCKEKSTYILGGLAKWALKRLHEIMQDLEDSEDEVKEEYKEEAALARLEKDCWDRIYNHVKVQCDGF